MAIGEFAVIDRYFRPLAGSGSFDLCDDAAAIRHVAGQDLILTTDTIAAGVHFFPDDPPGLIAQKVLRVNLSDLIAKGADPVGYLVSLSLPAPFDESWLKAFSNGLGRDQERFGVFLLGGDTVALESGPVITIAMAGHVPAGQMITRSGGRPGDRIFVSGEIGGPSIGLALRSGLPGPWDEFEESEKQNLIDSYLLPEPPLALKTVLRSYATAALDVSDGLIGDADKLAAASNCSATVDADAIPLHPGLRRIGNNDDVFELAVTGGDDYQVLFSASADNVVGIAQESSALGLKVTEIGILTEGDGRTRVERGGKPIDIEIRAYVHSGPHRVPND